MYTQDCHDKSSLQQEDDFFDQQIELNLEKQPVKCHIRSTDLSGAETGTVWKIGNIYFFIYIMLIVLLKIQSSLNVHTGRPPTGVMIPDAV